MFPMTKGCVHVQVFFNVNKNVVFKFILKLVAPNTFIRLLR